MVFIECYTKDLNDPDVTFGPFDTADFIGDTLWGDNTCIATYNNRADNWVLDSDLRVVVPSTYRAVRVRA